MAKYLKLEPWTQVSITTEIEHHTLVEMATLIIEDESGFFYLKEDFDKIKDVSVMPDYIKIDWINYNKKSLDLTTTNKHIKKYTDKIEKSFYRLPEELNEDLATLENLKSIRRDLIIKGII